MTIEERAQELIATVVDRLIGGELVSVDPDMLSDVLSLLRAAEAAAYERAAHAVETMPIFASPRDCAVIIRKLK